MRKIFAILLSVLMVASLLSFSISAEDTVVAKIVKADNTEKSYTVIDSAAIDLVNGDKLVILGSVETVVIDPAQFDNGAITIEGSANGVITSKLQVNKATTAATVTIKNLKIDQAAEVNTTAFQTYDNLTVKMENCTIHAVKGQAFNTAEGSVNSNVTFTDCTLSTDGGNLIYLRDGNDYTFVGCTLTGAAATGINVNKENEAKDGSLTMKNTTLAAQKTVYGPKVNGWKTNLENCTITHLYKSGSSDAMMYSTTTGLAFTAKNTQFVNECKTAIINLTQIDSTAMVLQNCVFENKCTDTEKCTVNGAAWNVPGFTEKGVTLSSGMVLRQTADGIEVDTALNFAKKDAKAAVAAAAAVSSSAEVAALVTAANTAIDAAETEAAVATAKTNGINAINAQLAKENIEPAPVTGDATVILTVAAVAAMLGAAYVCKKKLFD